MVAMQELLGALVGTFTRVSVGDGRKIPRYPPGAACCVSGVWWNDAVTRPRPRLDLVAEPVGARDLVVVAHGGQERSLEEPHDWRHAILRMWPFAAAARRAAAHAQVGLVRYRYRGWNGDEAHAAADLRRILDAVPAAVERIVLVGHSMGGRAVLSAADDARVVGVLGLAPWLPADEPHRRLHDRRVVLAHGDRDRTVDPRLTGAFARRVRGSGVPLALFDADDETHALLNRHGDWDELVRRFVRASLDLGRDQDLDKATTSDPDHGADPLPAWTRRRGTLGAVAGVAGARVRLRVR
jgi:pimeloyl-ACP methyl ester carboxylesterase